MSNLESRIVHCNQLDAEWFAARCGKVTASDVAKVLSFLVKGARKGGETAARAGYKASIIGEILTNEPDMDIGFTTGYMNRGNNEEPKAREVYQVVSDLEVRQVGFVLHPTIERAGASPDGLVVGASGMVEIKCPKSKTHIEYILNDSLPEEYEPQVMFELACTGLEWCDFVSYDSRMPARHRMFIKRVYRNEERIAEINAGVELFLSEAFDTIARMNGANPQPELVKEQLRKSVSLDDALLTDADIEWAKGGFK